MIKPHSRKYLGWQKKVKCWPNTARAGSKAHLRSHVLLQGLASYKRRLPASQGLRVGELHVQWFILLRDTKVITVFWSQSNIGSAAMDASAMVWMHLLSLNGRFSSLGSPVPSCKTQSLRFQGLRWEHHYKQVFRPVRNAFRSIHAPKGSALPEQCYWNRSRA